MAAAPRFQDQVVVVTGATSGIGLEVARAFAREGARVVGTGRDQARLALLAQEVDLALTLDVTDAEEVEMALSGVLDRYGRVDVLVNNAGVGLFKDWLSTPLGEVQRLLDVNLYGAIRCTQRVLGGMIERGQGTIVNVASVAGKRGYKNHTAYCASKHALIGWSEALRCEVAPEGVRVVVVCPPAVRTPFFENAGYLTFDEDHPGFTPMGPETVAAALVDATARGERERVVGLRAKVLNTLHLLAPEAIELLRRFK